MKTYSQKLAQGYAIGGCVVLLPIILVFAFTFLSYLVDGNNPVNQPINPAHPPIPTPINDSLFMFGIVMVTVLLIIGYFKHARSRLGTGLTTTMCVGTSLFASMFLSPMFALLRIMYREFNGGLEPVLIVGAIDIIFILLCFTAITLPIIAIILNRKFRMATKSSF